MTFGSGQRSTRGPLYRINTITPATLLSYTMESLASANAHFSLELFKKISEKNKTVNVFYSPLSIFSALAMVCLGAKGNTEAQMYKSLKTQGAPYTLGLTNHLYGDQYQFVEDLLAPGILCADTRLVLVNAIYFKVSWDRQFNSAQTKEVQFKLNKNASKPVQMMQQKAKFPFTYIPYANCQILEMPYLEQMLTYENFAEWTKPDMMDTVEVQVGLPKFKLEEKYDLKEILVVHKSFVEVNEEGTEGAAATGGGMMITCFSPPKRFMADHPFLFIRHNPTQSVLFYGRYSSP
ncbi:hypothetical protein AALO_G00292210 [Alosa alosa]|uniref:Serpin domain-containing protein n=1 Tax=Alosa alosa TaxID=278164 RepID=A0AAV6FH16_9TELE|nr:hypothetical protein AALO_G00292210 [Alosa alosa]